MADGDNMSLSWKNADGDIITTTTVNTEITGNFAFLDDDVSAMYVDWDDGESNKKTEANYQWAQYTEPVSSDTIKHQYNLGNVTKSSCNLLLRY